MTNPLAASDGYLSKASWALLTVMILGAFFQSLVNLAAFSDTSIADLVGFACLGPVTNAARDDADLENLTSAAGMVPLARPLGRIPPKDPLGRALSFLMASS